jgi:hypothetical protein
VNYYASWEIIVVATNVALVVQVVVLRLICYDENKYKREREREDMVGKRRKK